MLIIKLKDGNITKALKELKVKFTKIKIVKELNERKQYLKKSVKLRQSKIKAIYKQLKDNDTKD